MAVQMISKTFAKAQTSTVFVAPRGTLIQGEGVTGIRNSQLDAIRKSMASPSHRHAPLGARLDLLHAPKTSTVAGFNTGLGLMLLLSGGSLEQLESIKARN
ncbi:hypothetical protein CGRA01v4_00072 [Colletotrichum graminicola]|nr:hypothetical protein CGRA01v4_00072 [Colletotrichum graminicola]